MDLPLRLPTWTFKDIVRSDLCTANRQIHIGTHWCEDNLRNLFWGINEYYCWMKEDYSIWFPRKQWDKWDWLTLVPDFLKPTAYVRINIFPSEDVHAITWSTPFKEIMSILSPLKKSRKRFWILVYIVSDSHWSPRNRIQGFDPTAFLDPERLSRETWASTPNSIISKTCPSNVRPYDLNQYYR